MGRKRYGKELKAAAWISIFIERLWRSVKYEKIFLEELETVPELLAGLKGYLDLYTFERPHQF